MANKKPKKARLKLAGAPAGDVLPDDGQIDYVKKIRLNIEGQVDAVGAAKTYRVQIRVFYRVNGVPFASKVTEESVVVAAGNTAFSITDFEFTPRNRAVHSFRVLAWDRTNAGDVPTRVRDIRTHLIRQRVKT